MAVTVGKVKVRLFARIEGVNHDFEVGTLTVDVPIKVVGVEAIVFVTNSVAESVDGLED
jgi:hypothetical protein